MTQHSAASDKCYNFELVAGFKDAFGVAGSRDEFEVSFDGQISRLHLQQREQFRDGTAVGDLASFVVDDDFHGDFQSG